LALFRIFLEPAREPSCYRRRGRAPFGRAPQWRTTCSTGRWYFYWALVFFIVAIIAAFFGFGGAAATAAGIAQVLFFVFLVIFLIALVMGVAGRRRPPI
jgi:uncharacterized membrane protein YtjA (UPF0391 family)